MKILIIGGTGVLSKAVTKEAMCQNIAVTMINRGNRPIPTGVNHIKADKNAYKLLSKKLNGMHFDAVIDFLCYTDEETTRSFRFYSAYTAQYFFISSCAVYDKTWPGIKDEDSQKPNKVWSYSVNKYESEVHLAQLAEEVKCNYTIVRPCVTYDDTRIPYGILPQYGYHWTLCARILAGKPIIRWNGGVNKSNMMRVEDFAVGLVGLIGKPAAYNDAFNICGDETPSFNDVLEVLGSLLEKQIVTVDVSSEFYAAEIPHRKGEILGGRSMDALNSNEKIKRLVPNFKQSIFLEGGIQKTVNAYKEQNYQRGIDWDFDASTDRIIKKWCKQNKQNWRQYNLDFVDYLGTAKRSDKIYYFIIKNKNNPIVKGYILLNKAFRSLDIRVNKLISKL
jgi:nucleoside-diphosphate-sugar epimerase